MDHSLPSATVATYKRQNSQGQVRDSTEVINWFCNMRTASPGSVNLFSQETIFFSDSQAVMLNTGFISGN